MVSILHPCKTFLRSLFKDKIRPCDSIFVQKDIAISLGILLDLLKDRLNGTQQMKPATFCVYADSPNISFNLSLDHPPAQPRVCLQ